MERAKKARGPHRTSVVRIIQKLEAELAKPTVDAETLETLRDKLVQEQATLQIHNAKIMDAMLDANEEEAAIQQEHDGAESYSDKIILYLKKLSKLSCFAETNSNGSSENDTIHPKKYKLPKIELQKFSGDLKSWLGWWSQFKRIHEDADLHKSDKFHYLIQATEINSEAREIVAAYPPTSDNYDEAVDALKERYGRENLQLQLYIRELLNLVITNATSPDKLPIQSLFIKLDSYIRSLKSLNLSNEDPSTYFYPLVESCLSEELLRAWRRCTSMQTGNEGAGSTSTTDLDVLMEFLKKEVRNEQQIQLARSGFGSSKPSESQNDRGDTKYPGGKKRQFERHDTKQSVPTAAGLLTAKMNNCIFCGKSHASQECGSMEKMGLEEKRSKVKEKGACYVCLKPGHRSKVCKSFVKCHVCSKRHYTNMCPDVAAKKTKIDENVAINSNVVCKNDVLLKTLVVWARGPRGQIKVRLISDEGSQSSHIGKAVVEKTGSLKVGSTVTRNVLFGGKVTEPITENLRRIQIESLDGKVTKEWVLRERPVICPGIPRIPKGSWLEDLKQIHVFPVDTDDVKVDLPNVEILIGQDLLNEMVTNHRIKLSNRLAAVKTIFGWCICGPTSEADEIRPCVNLFNGHRSVPDLWSLELLGVRDPSAIQSEEEKNAEAKAHFIQHVRRHESGRYIVRLPWIVENPPLWRNNEKAKSRLVSMTKRLKSKGKFAEYDAVLKQWLSEGLIEESSSTTFHLIPHHPVYKPSSKTTPIRPVFDASAKVAGCPSLNECLHKGPNLLELIPNMINQFRKNNVGVVADIRKAFQTIEVDEADRNYQSFMWWEDEQAERMKLYRHTRVVFGVNASPFLLAAVLEQHFATTSEDDKEFCECLKGSFYVDNLVTSFNDMNTYEWFKSKTCKLLADAQMIITQWEHSATDKCPVGEIELSKVLGLKWDKQRDEISVDVEEFLAPEKLTKRSALSLLHRVFDPLGFLAPATLPMKLLLQAAWKDKIGWDEEIPSPMKNELSSWMKDVHALGDVRIPRKMVHGEICELHTFVDASQRAFAAAVFLRSTNAHKNSVMLVQAKSRVAPLKPVSIPRLELLSCMLGARLASGIKKSLNISPDNCYYWSDSTTALSWIKREINWNVFVRNRVNEIKRLSTENWRYVPSQMNLADLPSRGCLPSKLLETEWWKGQEWLLEENAWPAQTFEVNESEIFAEAAKSQCILSVQKMESWFHIKFGRYSKNVRVMVYILRFINKCRKKSTEIEFSEEFATAEVMLLKAVQRECFDDEFFRRCKLKLMKGDDAIRVASKIFSNDDSPFYMPILVPARHPIIDQLIMEAHVGGSHAGVQVLMSRLREKYWVLRARKTIRRIINKCVTCRKQASKPATVASTVLPEFRTYTGDVFQSTGVDLAGPLILNSGEKAWVVLFTCAVYRAVYLDVVMSLTVAEFLGCLQRFICNFGRPSTICSDQGTNLVASKNLIDASDFNIENELQFPKIKWVLNPPSAPWWGGWWERLIKSVKDQLKRILGKARLNYDQLRTCLAVTMATINDRPLTAVSQDLDDLVPLTPSMFLHPLRFTSFTENLVPEKLPVTYKKMQSLVISLKQRFKREYLALLVQNKHDNPTRINIGDLVLVGIDNKKRVEWPLGRVLTLIPGKDGHCRVAKIRTASGVLVRPLQRLYPLEITNSNEKCDTRLYQTRSGREIRAPQYFTF